MPGGTWARAAWEQGTEVWGLVRSGILSLGLTSLLGGPEQIVFPLWASVISKACWVPFLLRGSLHAIFVTLITNSPLAGLENGGSGVPAVLLSNKP